MGKLMIGGVEPTNMKIGDITPTAIYAGTEKIWPPAPPVKGSEFFTVAKNGLLTPFTIPDGVTSIDVCCIGGGGGGNRRNNNPKGSGGGGGGLAWANNIPVTPGQVLYIRPGTAGTGVANSGNAGDGGNSSIQFDNASTGPIVITAFGGGGAPNNTGIGVGKDGSVNANYTSDYAVHLGGNGGNGGAGAGGGGGAAGYTGMGGNGGTGGDATNTATNGNGGGGAGGGNGNSGSNNVAGNGGGTGYNGQGANGLKGGTLISAGGAGSGGSGQFYGGGGGGSSLGSGVGNSGGIGVVFIRWGYSEKFPQIGT